jgi:hypothetical protein
MWLGLHPSILLPELNAVLYNYATRTYPNYKNMVLECFVKIFKMPIIDKIPQLGHKLIGKLIKSMNNAI